MIKDVKHVRAARAWRWLVLLLFIAVTACQPITPVTLPAATIPTAMRTRTPEPRPTPTATLQPELRVDEAELRGLQIRFLHPWAGATAEQIDLLVETFNRTNPWDFRVIAESAGGTGMLFQEVESRAGDDLPNLVAAPGEYLFTWQRAEPGRVVALNGYLGHAQWGLTDEQVDDFFPAFWGQDAAGGDRLGIPLLRDVSVLLYNLTWARELGFTRVPVTPDEFRQQACAAAQANRSDRTISNDGTGGWIVETRGVTLWSWLRGFGADPSPAGQDGYTFDTPETAEAFAFLRGLADENCAWKSRLAEPYDYFANRQALFYSGVLEDTLIQAHTMTRLQKTDEWTVIPYPSLDGEPVVVASGPSLAVLHSTPEEQLAAWLFLRWLITPAHLAELTEAAGGLPVTQSVLLELSTFGVRQPQWRAGLNYLEQVQTPPANAGWRNVRSLLEDAGYQALLPSVPPEGIPDVLQLLDEMILEVNATDNEN
jgi:ABC-type glycerol-3-phosphate transport system substrate-binding protein